MDTILFRPDTLTDREGRGILCMSNPLDVGLVGGCGWPAEGDRWHCRRSDWNSDTLHL
jgi:hypothetical protein